MRKIYPLLFAAILTISVYSQAPQKMSYQAVIRNNSNVLVTSHAVGMKISILQGSATGTPVYVETQTPTTNANGLASLEIGGGTPVTGTFAGIDWSAGPYFIKTETDPAGGTTYSISGTSQLLSVPYALYSKTSVSLKDVTISSTGDTLAIGTRKIIVPGLSAANPKSIIYSSDESGNSDIWKINIDGTNKTQLTTSTSLENEPRLSPNGNKVVYCSDKSSNTQIWMMNIDGTNQTQLTANDPGYNQLDPSWSRDGNYIYYSRGLAGAGICSVCPTYEIWRINADGTNPLKITNDNYRDHLPFLSPNGQKIAFIKAEVANDCCNQTDVCVMNTDGTNMVRIAATAGVYDWIVGGWSPDGNKILYLSGSAVSNLYIMNSDGSNKTLLASNAGMACFSSDGSKIFYINKSGQGGGDIWIMNLDGSNKLAITTTSYLEEYLDTN
jgi:dipeptidyl aminopeptidase/acylaminoacyl peptidase